MAKGIILYTNAQSFMVYKDEIYHQIMKKINPTIIALTETILTVDIEDYEVNVLHYSM